MSEGSKRPLATCGLCQSLDIEGNYRWSSGGVYVGGEELRESGKSCPGCAFILAGLQAWRLSSAAKLDDEGQRIPLGDLMLSPALRVKGVQIVPSSKGLVENVMTKDLAWRVDEIESEERETLCQMNLQVLHQRRTDVDWYLALGGHVANLQFYKISDDVDSFPCLSSSQRLTQATLDDSVMSTVTAMFAHCKKNHKECWENSQPFMPTRLIDVGRPGEKTATISLREHLSEPQPYLTLSYRWANNQDTALTTHVNREQRLRGFPAAELPPLMQDVVSMAHKLGIRYIWIDALCIIQDDREDWALEAPQMSHIYRESALTLSISTALDDSNNSITSRNLVDIPFSHPATAPTTDFFVRTDPTHNVPHNLTAIHSPLGPLDGTGKDLPTALAEKHPVFTRGWCFQERLLSRRVLHHTSTELIWACRRATWCECGATSRRHPAPRLHRPHRRKATIHQAPLSPRDLIPLVYEDWRMLVHDYSWNELTYDGDVLPAISGLAHAYRKELGGEFVTRGYYAGHWGRDLPHSLLWHTLDARDFVYVMAGTDVAMTNSRREAGVAPSWSWASVRGPVRWPTEGVFAVVNEFECARDGVEVEWAEVRAECKLQTGDEMGQLAGEAEMWVKTRVVREVRSAFLEACCSAPLGFAKEPPDDDVLFVSEMADGKKEVCMSVFLDMVEDKDAWRERSVWFARVCRVTREEDAELGEEGMKWRRRAGTVALMLIRRDDGKFRRIGIATSPRKRIDEVDVGIFAREVGDAKEMIDSPEDNAFDECFDSVEEIEICIV